MSQSRSFGVLLLLVTLISATTTEARQSGINRSYYVDSDSHLGFGLTAELERWDGYTEYEIDVGYTTYGPTQETVFVGSRLRFPVEATALKLGGILSYSSFILDARVFFSVSNSDNLLKDWDWYEGSGGQQTFIYGVAGNDESMFGIGLSAGYELRAGALKLTPKVSFDYWGFEFDNENLTQINYAGFDQGGRIWPLETPDRFDTTGAVLRYAIDYFLLSAGGEVSFESGVGLFAQADFLFSPLTFASDLDEHLLRGKESETSSSGTSGKAEILAGFRILKNLAIHGAVSYRYIDTGGNQTQRIPREDGNTVDVTIPATTLAEWAVFSGGLTYSFHTPFSR